MSWEEEAKKVFESARQGTKQEEVKPDNDEQPPVENSNQDVWTPVIGEHLNLQTSSRRTWIVTVN